MTNAIAVLLALHAVQADTIPAEGHARPLRGLRAASVSVSSEFPAKAAADIEKQLVAVMKERDIAVLPSTSGEMPILSVSLDSASEAGGVAYAVSLELLEVVPSPRSPGFSAHASTWAEVLPGWVADPALLGPASATKVGATLEVFRRLHRDANGR